MGTARMIKDHLANVLTFVTHRITTATSEGTNSRSRSSRIVLAGTGSVRNREHFKTAIFFHCGGLSLYPPLN
jgi:transposase